MIDIRHFLFQSHKNAGFTLIEILIVVAIIGILAVMATLSYPKIMLIAQKNHTLGLLEQIETAKISVCLAKSLNPTDAPQVSDVGYYFVNTSYPQTSMFPDPSGTFIIGTCTTVPASYTFSTVTCRATNPSGTGGCV